MANRRCGKCHRSELTKHEKEAAGTAFHYAMGADVGRVVGCDRGDITGVKPARACRSRGRLGFADEGIVPALDFKVPGGVHDFYSRLCVYVAPGFGLKTRSCVRAMRSVM